MSLTLFYFTDVIMEAIESKGLWVLKPTTSRILSENLDTKKWLPAENGIFRDFRGLIDLVNKDLSSLDKIREDQLPKQGKTGKSYSF